VEAAQGLGIPVVARGGPGLLELAQAVRKTAGEVAAQLFRCLVAFQGGPQGRRDQMPRTVSARVMGSNGLAITSAAPSSR
jgi:hypothetical protein